MVVLCVLLYVSIPSITEPGEGNDDEDFPLWAIIVAAVGGATILFVIVILIIFLVRYRITSSK